MVTGRSNSVVYEFDVASHALEIECEGVDPSEQVVDTEPVVRRCRVSVGMIAEHVRPGLKRDVRR